MFHRLLAALTIGALALGAAAQTTSEPTPLGDETPRTNATGERLRERAPGNIIRDALDVHRAINGSLLEGRRGDEDTSATSGGSGTTAGGTTGGATSGLGGLLDAFGGLAGLGNLSGLGDLTGLLGGTGLTTGGGGTTTGASGGLSADEIERQILDGIAAAGGTANKTTTRQTADEFGGAIARLPKAEALQQTVDTEEEPFRIRLVNAWLGAAFSALTFGFQTQDFIDLLESGLRPLFTPPTTSDGDGDTGGDDATDGDGIEGVDSDAGDGGGETVV